jgi:2-(1,2-epoxy-1,2-dihydrophenyl)acetyl-CoA isomerase
MMAAETSPGLVQLTWEGSVARITLARPDGANAVNLPLARQFLAAVTAARDGATKAVLLAAEGSSFCAGGDVLDMAAATDPQAYLLELATTFHDALIVLENCDAPILAAVNGAAAGAGLGLVLSADVVIASDRARFLTAYDRLGLTPDSGVSARLPRAIGAGRARAMSTLGTVLDPETALQWGLVSEVVPHELLDTRSVELAARIAARYRGGMGATRRLYAAGAEASLEVHLEREARSIAAAVLTDTARRAVADFARPAIPNEEKR